MYLKMITILVFFTCGLFAQSGTGTITESDPQAKVILDKISKTWTTYNTIKTHFILRLEVPGEDVILKNGIHFQKGDKYRIEMDDQVYQCNGELIWLYMPGVNEVQIYNADIDEQDAIFSPMDLLKVYNSGKYIYAITNEFCEEKINYQQI